ncbi:MAG: hypothetical protein GY740_13455, partial [Gammaproteobacteria bacterium]|nr:hypothetical protein [Gammaproteobacteria bacterium]
RKAIQTRQAKAEKKQALFKVAIDTAQAIVSSIAKSPETFGLPFSAFAAAAGLAQSAIIASQQIPQFWQGGTVEQGGTIMVNDDPFGKKGSNYKEVAETPKGQLLFPQGKNVKMNVPKGTKIHSTYTDFLNDINSNLFKPNNIAPIDMRSGIIPMIQNNGMDKNDLKEVFSNEIGRLNNTIKNKP